MGDDRAATRIPQAYLDNRRAKQLSNSLTHGVGPRFPQIPTDWRKMVSRLAKKQKKRQQNGGLIKARRRRARIKQKGGSSIGVTRTMTRRKPLNNVPTHYQYYQ